MDFNHVAGMVAGFVAEHKIKPNDFTVEFFEDVEKNGIIVTPLHIAWQNGSRTHTGILYIPPKMVSAAVGLMNGVGLADPIYKPGERFGRETPREDYKEFICTL